MGITYTFLGGCADDLVNSVWGLLTCMMNANMVKLTMTPGRVDTDAGGAVSDKSVQNTENCGEDR